MEHEDLFERLSRSTFRSSFKLKEKDKKYVLDKGDDKIRDHARKFISQRLAPTEIPNDGKQTPMRGHPIFIAQHATACCCRGCMEKWHHFPKGIELTKEQQDYVVDVLMDWIDRQMEGYEAIEVEEEAQKEMKKEQKEEYEQMTLPFV